MAKNFLDLDPDPKKSQHLSWADGFRFGFGFLAAWAVGALIISAAAWIALEALHLHQ
jgi:hypothetical protein